MSNRTEAAHSDLGAHSQSFLSQSHGSGTLVYCTLALIRAPMPARAPAR